MCQFSAQEDNYHPVKIHLLNGCPMSASYENINFPLDIGHVQQCTTDVQYKICQIQ